MEFTSSCENCKKNNLSRYLITGGILIFLLAIISYGSVSLFDPPPSWEQTFLVPSQNITVSQTLLTVAIADSDNEITQGLSGRKALQDNQGLLFIFNDSDYRTFWMKDMKFAIDMIFIREGIIVDIAKNMPPPKFLEYPATYKSQNPADMVLEVTAGLSDLYGWKIGDKIIINN